MTPKSLALAAATVLASTGAVAAADVLFSPPLVPEGQNTLDCYLVNVSNAPRRVKIEVFSRDGSVVEGGTIATTLGPGQEDVARDRGPAAALLQVHRAGQKPALPRFRAGARRGGRRHQRAAGFLIAARFC